MSYTIEQLETMLKEAKAAEAARLKMAANSVEPVYRVTVAPIEQKFDKIYDPSVTAYRIEGTCTNKKECGSVGRAYRKEGGLDYLFNHATGRIIGNFGGGTVWFGSGLNRRYEDLVAQAMDEISEFIVRHPQGGNITHIYDAFQSIKNEKK